MSKHTPGPWATEIAEYGSKHIGTVFGGSTDIARIVPVAALDGIAQFSSTTDANARLIAAAPDLLLALEMLLDWHLGTVDGADDADVSAVRDARAAIAKATGEQS